MGLLSSYFRYISYEQESLCLVFGVGIGAWLLCLLCGGLRNGDDGSCRWVGWNTIELSM